EMKSDLNPYFARDIFIGTMEHLVTRWLLKDRSYSLFENLEEIFNLMVNGFKSNGSGSTTGSELPD
ncbi:MAG: TetR/AcrR family transcriptional regulator C-terminal domain-containing protein, partial [Pseudomonadota bacterium]